MNENPNLTEFSGVAGRVLARAIGMPSLLSGIALMLILVVGNAALVFGGVNALTTPFTQVIVAFAMARFALNGMFGEWGGTIFSTEGGTWGAVAGVTLRYLALSLLWLVPVLLLAPGEEQIGAMMMLGPAAAGGLMGFLGVYMLGMTLTPPIFLIAATRADGFGDLFRGEMWRETFGGRFGDQFEISAIYTGGIAMALVLCIPLVLFAFSAGVPVGVAVSGACCCLLIGIAANLLGRLCGFFACGELGLPAPEQAGAEPIAPAPLRPVTPARPEPAGPASLPVAGEVSAPLTPSAIPVTPAEQPAVAVAAAPATPDAQPAVAGATALAAAPASDADQGEKLPPLMDAQQRVDALMGRLAQEPDGVLAGLQDLDRSYATHPLVLQALCICLSRVGRVEEGLETARSAVSLCFERGHHFLAANIFKEYRAHLEALGLSRDQVLVIGQSMQKRDDLGGAAQAFTAVISTDPGDVRAIKGLLQVADEILHGRTKPAAAAKVYRYLLAHCASSPLAEFMRSGLEECERQVAAG